MSCFSDKYMVLVQEDKNRLEKEIKIEKVRNGFIVEA